MKGDELLMHFKIYYSDLNPSGVGNCGIYLDI